MTDKLAHVPESGGGGGGCGYNDGGESSFNNKDNWFAQLDPGGTSPPFPLDKRSTWSVYGLFGACLMLPLLHHLRSPLFLPDGLRDMDDMVSDDPASQYASLGSVFIAIAIVVWTSIAFWLFHGGPYAGEVDPDLDLSLDGSDIPDGVVGRVARDVAELLLEGKEKGGPNARLDLSKVEELFAQSKILENRGSGSSREALLSAKKHLANRGFAAKLAGKDGAGALQPTSGLTSLNLGKDVGVGSDNRAGSTSVGASSVGGSDGRGSNLGARGAATCSTSGTVAGAEDDGRGIAAQDLALFKEQLREKLAQSLGCATGAGKKAAIEDLGALVGSSRSRVDVADPTGGARREAIEDFLKQLLHPPAGGARGDDKLGNGASSGNGRSSTLRGKLLEELDDKEASCGGQTGQKSLQHQRPSAAMLSMAEQAREIGNKYLQDRHFAAAAHCYEVACLLYPVSGGTGSGQLAAYHCNCALACLELGRYGDAINEGSAALVLTPPRHIAVKALYRMAVAHVNLKNPYEARRCLQRCLEHDPENEYAKAFLSKIGEEYSAPTCSREHCLTWVDPPKGLQNLSSLARAKGKRGKQKNGLTGADDATNGTSIGGANSCGNSAIPGGGGVTSNGVCGANSGAGASNEYRLDRDAALWHTVARHNSKLYILGGWPDKAGARGTGSTLPGGAGSGTGSPPGGCHGGAACTGKVQGDGGGCSTATPGGAPIEARGSDELHVLDIDTFELRQLTGPNSKPPHPCYCHTATMAGGNMVVFGGLGPPLNQPPLVMVFDVQQAKWRVPATAGVPPRQRQGHTANAVQGDRLLCVFGGIEPTGGEQRVARVYNDIHMLDLVSFVWRKMEVAGHRPPARFGHTATNLPGTTAKLLIIGGRDHLGGTQDPALPGGFTGLHILDTERRVWMQQPFAGSPPAQAFYHSATLIDDSTLLCLSSGANAGGDSMPLHLLDLEAWQWSSPSAGGVCPPPRVGHVAAAAGGRVFVFGGAVRRGGQAVVDKAVHILEVGLVRQRQDTAARSPSPTVQRSLVASVVPGAVPAGAGFDPPKSVAPGFAAGLANPPSIAASSGFPSTLGLAPTLAFTGTNNATTRLPSPKAMQEGVAGNFGQTVADAMAQNAAATGASVIAPVGAGVGNGGGASREKSYTNDLASLVSSLTSTAASSAFGSPRVNPPVPSDVAVPTTVSGAFSSTAPSSAGSSRDARIEKMMLQDDSFEDEEEGTELSFEELLEQEKAFFKAQSEKVSFPRSAGKETIGKKGPRW